MITFFTMAAFAWKELLIFSIILCFLCLFLHCASMKNGSDDKDGEK